MKQLAFGKAQRAQQLCPEYAELQITTNFSFLRGASHPQELIYTAHALGYRAIAITDRNSLAGAVRAHAAAKESGISFRVGAQLTLCEDKNGQELPFSILAYPIDRRGYGNLCRMLTTGKLRVEKGGCLLLLEDIFKLQEGLIFIATHSSLYHCKPVQADDFLGFCRIVKANVTANLFSIALSKNYGCREAQRLKSIQNTAAVLELPLVVVNEVYYHHPDRRPLQDIITCIRTGSVVTHGSYKLFQNSERQLKSPAEMHRLFKEHPKALKRTLEISEMTAGFSLEELCYEYPDELCPSGETPLAYLKKLTAKGAHTRYPGGVPHKVQALIESEFKLIHELHYEKYFLTCWDIVRFARSRNILCQGRGAAANSAVCYCLGITAVDPEKIDLLFARFISKERAEPPDIDIDFEHERREEVIQYIYEKYGRERAGLTSEVITYRRRSAIRDVGKALGLPQQTVEQLAKRTHQWTGGTTTPKDLAELGLSDSTPAIANLLRLSSEIIGFPRHLSQHVGGFVISQHPLCETVPILNARMQDRTIIEWDKNDIEELGMLKIDILGLGMLTCIRKAIEYINADRMIGRAPLELHTIPSEEPAVYEMISTADTIGVFQIESRAQMSMLPRLKPRCFYDLVIEVAIVRPGPIQGKMIHPYLRRRSGLEKPFYPDRRVEEILGKTMGVPLFQEQAMRLAIVLANFSAGEAEQLRRAMGAWKRNKDLVASFQNRIIEGMLLNGYSREFAEHCVSQIRGFSEYGFPESHAASFALLVYASAWIKRFYPAEFATALLNSQPMGFYAPAQIINDAKSHGITIRPLDLNHSDYDCTVASDGTLRIGMRLIKHLERAQARLVVQAVKESGPFKTITELWHAAHPALTRLTMTVLARADAFGSLGVSRRQALWEIRSLPKQRLPMDKHYLNRCQKITLPQANEQMEMFSDLEATGISLRSHPIKFLREQLKSRGVRTVKELRDGRFAGSISVAGVVLFKQRPPTANGVVFITLEDESGIVNLIVKAKVFERYQREILTSSALIAEGRLDRLDAVLYVNTERVERIEATPGSSYYGACR